MANEDHSSELCKRVMFRIMRAKRRKLLQNVVAHGILAAVAFLILLPAISNFSNNIAQSKFSQFASLALSDWSSLARNWTDIIYSMLGSWPVVWSIAIIGAFIVILNSVRRLALDTTALSTYKHAVL